MFYTPKPRRFHYKPRFYDPEKEKWEALKKKYSEQQPTTDTQHVSDAELDYFEQRVSEIEDVEKRQSRKLGIRDLFKRREMPKFNYQPRFQGTAVSNTEQQANSTTTESGIATGPNGGDIIEKYREQDNHRHKIKIRRRFDIGDTEYMKPVSGGKIMLYALLACLLLYLILF